MGENEECVHLHGIGASPDQDSCPSPPPPPQANTSEYQMRYFKCDEYYQPGGPFFVVTGGEAEVEHYLKYLGTSKVLITVTITQLIAALSIAPACRFSVGDCSHV